MMTSNPIKAHDLSKLNIAVLLPCYNEAGAIGQVVKDFKAALPSAHIYVYDNNSTDNTFIEAKEAGAIVKREYRQGKGNVVRAMFMDIDADYYIMADGDGECEPQAALAMINLAIQKDGAMVIGVRSSDSAKKNRFLHDFGNSLFNKISRLIFGRGVSDILSGYRVFSKKFVKSSAIISESFEIEVELTAHALNARLPVFEVPCHYKERIEGTVSKLNTFKDGFKIIFFILQLFKEYRPFLLFSLLSLIPTIISLLFFYPIMVEFLSHGRIIALPTVVLCAALGVLSVVLFSCGIVLNSIARQNLRQFIRIYMNVGK